MFARKILIRISLLLLLGPTASFGSELSQISSDFYYNTMFPLANLFASSKNVSKSDLDICMKTGKYLEQVQARLRGVRNIGYMEVQRQMTDAKYDGFIRLIFATSDRTSRTQELCEMNSLERSELNKALIALIQAHTSLYKITNPNDLDRLLNALKAYNVFSESEFQTISTPMTNTKEVDPTNPLPGPIAY